MYITHTQEIPMDRYDQHLTNAELLRTQKGLLTVPNQQRAFMLKIALARLECPACGKAHSRIEAAGKTFDTYDIDHTPDDDQHTCPASGIGLTWILPFPGPPTGRWQLTKPAAELLTTHAHKETK